MPANSRAINFRRIQTFKMASFFLLLIMGLITVLLIQNLLLSLVIALVISFFVSPLVSYLEGTGIDRTLSIVLVYIIFSVFSALLIWAISPFLVEQFANFKGQLPKYVDDTVKMMDLTVRTLESYTGEILNFDLSNRLRNLLTSQSSALVEGLPQVLSSSASVLFLSPLIGFFILKDGRKFSRALLNLVPNNIFELSLSLQHQITEQIASYIRARIFQSLFVGAVCLIGFYIVGAPYAVLLSLFAALANFIPYVGPLVGAAPGIILAFLNNSSSLMFFLIVTVYVIAQVIDNLIVIPLVVARIVDLHPLTVILVVLLGAQFMGVMGMLISIPVASTLKVTFRNIYAHLTD